MTLYFPDVNTWLALAWEQHVHHAVAVSWSGSIPNTSRLIFSRYSQLGLLRLTTNRQLMGASVLSLEKAFALYDSLMDDPRIRLEAEPRELDGLMRAVSQPLYQQPATKAIGDLYLMSFAIAAHATMVTFDRAMARALTEQRAPVVLLSN